MIDGFLRTAFAMRRVGWQSLIPIKKGAKVPVIDGWPEFGPVPPSDHQLTRWGALYGNAGVGFVYGGEEKILGVDLDFLDEEIANRAFAAMKGVLGPTNLLRIGRHPKRLCLYRYAGKESLPGKVFGRFELFLKTGQTVFAGIHPDTSRAYEWPIKSPQDIPPLEAPEVTHGQVLQLIETLRPLGAPEKAARGSNSGRAAAVGAPTGAGASDRCSGAVARVLPVLRAAESPLVLAAEIVAAACPGSRYPTAFGVVVSLVKLGYDDKAVWKTVSPPFAAHFSSPAERRARLTTIASALCWARAEIGPDATTLAAEPAIQSLRLHWEAGGP